MGTPARSEQLLARFFDDTGRLRQIPARAAKRRVVLDHVARLFEPGVRYSESQLNAALRAVYPDVAALRRYLVDEQFLSRDHGTYWRSGGTVEV